MGVDHSNQWGRGRPARRRKPSAGTRALYNTGGIESTGPAAGAFRKPPARRRFPNADPRGPAEAEKTIP